jgi:hypothetical protein
MLRNGFLILVTGVLTFWLEGGFPPTIFLLLFRVWFYPSTLSTQNSQATFWAMAFLLGQALLLVAAWSTLISLAIYEYAFFLSSRSGSLQGHTHETDTPQGSAGKSTGPTVPSVALAPIAASSQPLALKANDLVAKTHLLPKDIFSLFVNTKTRLPGKGYELDTLGQRKRVSAKEKSKPPYHNPYAEEVFKNPFENADQTSTGGKRRSTIHAQALPEETVEQQQEEVADSHYYVYGNPFDGPLPEVFEYDTDLKVELEQEREAALHEGQSSAGSNRNTLLPRTSIEHALASSGSEKKSE